MAVTTPERAVGRTTDHTVRHCGAPRANEASRKPPGTTRSTSSMTRVTEGRRITIKASAAANPEKERTWVEDEDRVDEDAGHDGRCSAHGRHHRADRRTPRPADLVEEDGGGDGHGHADGGGQGHLFESADDGVEDADVVEDVRVTGRLKSCSSLLKNTPQWMVGIALTATQTTMKTTTPDDQGHGRW